MSLLDIRCFSGKENFRLLNLVECAKARSRDGEKGEMFSLALSGLLCNLTEAVSCRSDLTMQALCHSDTPLAGHQLLMSYSFHMAQ